MGYGRQRVWGTIGFGITAFFSGYLIDLWSVDDDIKSYTPAFILVFIFCITDLLCCTKLEVKINYKSLGSNSLVYYVERISLYILVTTYVRNGKYREGCVSIDSNETNCNFPLLCYNRWNSR